MSIRLGPTDVTAANAVSARVATDVWLVAMALFTATWVLLGFFNSGYVLFDTVVDEYSAIHQPISGLGLGSTATVMNTAFVVYGVLALAGAVGTSYLVGRIERAAQRPASITLGMHGAGSILVGVWTLESMELHSVGFLLVLAPIVGFWIIGRRLGHQPELRTFAKALTRIAAPVTILLVLAFFVSFNPEAAGEGQGVAGLIQRALVLHLQLWMGALAWLGCRQARQADTASSAK